MRRGIDAAHGRRTHSLLCGAETRGEPDGTYRCPHQNAFQMRPDGYALLLTGAAGSIVSVATSGTLGRAALAAAFARSSSALISCSSVCCSSFVAFLNSAIPRPSDGPNSANLRGPNPT